MSDANDTPVECPQPWSSNPGPRLSGTTELEIPHEPPPFSRAELPPGATDRDLVHAYMNISAHYVQHAIYQTGALRRILAHVSIGRPPRGYGLLVAVVVALVLSQALDLFLLVRIENLLAHIRQ